MGAGSLAGSGDKARLHMWDDNPERLEASIQIHLRNPVFSWPREPEIIWDWAPQLTKEAPWFILDHRTTEMQRLIPWAFDHASGTAILSSAGRTAAQQAWLWLKPPFPFPHPLLLLSRAFLFRLTSLLLWQSPIKLSSRTGWKAVFPVHWKHRV